MTNDERTKARKKVLVVDDEADMVVSLAAMLEDHGYEAVQARSAEEAFMRIMESRPDLVCLDIMMPGQSGIALYRKLKLDERTKGIPAVFISAFSMARDFTGTGFRKLIPEPAVPEPAAYLEKPFKADRLLEIIREVIG